MRRANTIENGNRSAVDPVRRRTQGSGWAKCNGLSRAVAVLRRFRIHTAVKSISDVEDPFSPRIWGAAHAAPFRALAVLGLFRSPSQSIQTCFSSDQRLTSHPARPKASRNSLISQGCLSGGSPVDCHRRIRISS